MFKKLKSMVKVLTVVVLAAQLTGCYYGVDRHYHPWWHHHAAVDVYVR